MSVCRHGVNLQKRNCYLCQDIEEEQREDEQWGEGEWRDTPVGEQRVYQEPQRRAFADIDESRLDQEWRGQPGLFLNFRDQLAWANKEVVVTKGRLKLVEAELQLDIRKNPQKHGLDGKPTDKTTEAAVHAHPRYQKALEEHNQALYQAELLDGAVEALRQRKNALENLVQLEGIAYHSEPRVKGNRPKQAELEEENKKQTRRQAMGGSP